MPAAVTDTHSLIWYLEDSPRLGQAAGEFIDACAQGENIVFVPTICLVEILFLCEKGRIRPEWYEVLNRELWAGETGLIVTDLTYPVVKAISRVPRQMVPEMPDRIIAATALSLGVPLISRDHAFAKVPGLEII